MFFGGIRGFDVFFPAEIAVRTEPAPVVLTELLLANRPVPAGRAVDGRALLPSFVTYADEVVLSHRDDVVSLELAALHFAAVCLATLDPDRRELAFVNAGLCEPLLRSGDTATYLASEGSTFPLGAGGRGRDRARTIRLSPGDVVVLYTDGVPEAAGRAGTPWGYDAFAGFLRGLPAVSRTAREVRDAIVREVARVTGSSRPADDVAVVVVRAL